MAMHYIPSVLLASVVVLCYPSSEVLWIVGKMLLLLVLLHSISEEKLAELATTSASENVVAEPVSRVFQEHPRTTATFAAVAINALGASSRSRR